MFFREDGANLAGAAPAFALAVAFPAALIIHKLIRPCRSLDCHSGRLAELGYRGKLALAGGKVIVFVSL